MTFEVELREIEQYRPYQHIKFGLKLSISKKATSKNIRLEFARIRQLIAEQKSLGIIKKER